MAIVDPRQAGGKTIVFYKVRAPHSHRQAMEHLIVGAGNHHPVAVGRAVVVMGYRAVGLGPHPLPDRPGRGVNRHQLIEESGHTVVEGHINVLSQPAGPPLLQGQHDTKRPVQASHVVGQRGGPTQAGLSVRLAGQEAHPAERLRHPGHPGEVAHRAHLAEAGHR